jgi:hypothetical protein
MLATILIFLIGINPATVYAKTELIIEGNILGYESQKIRPFGTFASEIAFAPVLLKVTKVLGGAERSEYIKVLTHSFAEGYVNKNFDLDKTVTFKLLRAAKCDEKLGGLVAKQVKTNNIFTLVSGVEKNSLPLEKKIPCYVGLYE